MITGGIAFSSTITSSTVLLFSPSIFPASSIHLYITPSLTCTKSICILIGSNTVNPDSGFKSSTNGRLILDLNLQSSRSCLTVLFIAINFSTVSG